jgi:hypothetical protein
MNTFHREPVCTGISNLAKEDPDNNALNCHTMMAPETGSFARTSTHASDQTYSVSLL